LRYIGIYVTWDDNPIDSREREKKRTTEKVEEEIKMNINIPILISGLENRD
jgi:hypothetical protein